MYHYVAFHIKDCIADWAVHPSIIHKVLLIGQCPVSETDTKETIFKPVTHTATVLHRLINSWKQCRDQYIE